MYTAAWHATEICVYSYNEWCWQLITHGVSWRDGSTPVIVVLNLSLWHYIARTHDLDFKAIAPHIPCVILTIHSCASHSRMSCGALHVEAESHHCVSWAMHSTSAWFNL